MIPRLARAIAMNAATCKSNRDDTRFDCNEVARKPQGSSVTMLLEPDFQCVALIGATVKLGQKLDNQPFKSCFQTLKARLIHPIMYFSQVGKNDRKLIEKLQTPFVRAHPPLQPRHWTISIVPFWPRARNFPLDQWLLSTGQKNHIYNLLSGDLTQLQMD